MNNMQVTDDEIRAHIDDDYEVRGKPYFGLDIYSPGQPPSESLISYAKINGAEVTYFEDSGQLWIMAYNPNDIVTVASSILMPAGAQFN